MDFPPFPGIRDQGLDFLRQLAANNDRDWFKVRKVIYQDELQWPLRCLLVDCGRALGEAGLPLTGDPKQGMFRIYRDTRFSKNKQPYKTHVGAVLSRTGHRNDLGGVYVHVQPGNSFMAAGFWQPESKILRRIRERMVNDPDTYLDLHDSLQQPDLTYEAQRPLKRMPRGFESFKEAPVAPFLKWKSFILQRPIEDARVQTPALTQDVVDFCKAALPLLTYGWEAAEVGVHNPTANNGN